MGVEVALQWCSDTFSDLLVGFVNSVKTIDGGTHIEGFKVCSLVDQASPLSMPWPGCLHKSTQGSRHLAPALQSLCSCQLCRTHFDRISGSSRYNEVSGGL